MTAITLDPAVRECLICTTVLTPQSGINSERLPCGHVHCMPCIRANLRVAMRTAPFRPVQCCMRIGMAVLRKAAPSTDLHPYRQRLSEFDAAEKLYCWDPKCSAFIPPLLRAGRAATCRQCHTKTCTDCRARFHFGLCKEITSNASQRRQRQCEGAFRRLSLLMKWKSCPQCKRMVEKTAGCNHISCVCGCHWCYRCGKAPYGNHGPCAM